jgi:potassium/hydrogen antiporter
VRRLLPALLLVLVLIAVPMTLAQDNGTAPSERTGIDATQILLTLAVIIGLGFGGFLVFDRFRVADTIFLIGFGILLAWTGFLDADLFRSFQPLVAAFAVLIIMFDAGLELQSGDLAISRTGWGIAFSTIGFILTVSLVAGVAYFFLGVDWLLALILGCAVSDTAGLVILPIVSQLGVPPKVRAALLVDTSLPDVFAIMIVLLLMNIVAPLDTASTDFGSSAANIIGGMATTLLLGLLVGALWIRALGWLSTRQYAYMTTLAMVLALNWAVSEVGGSGPIAVLLFGLIIGNRELLGEWSETGRQKVFRDMTQFNGEVAFLVRSFFFVYLGVILDLGSLNRRFVLTALIIVGAILLARVIAVYSMTLRPGVMRNYRGLLLAAIPRGTTAAVVSTLPASRGISGTEAFASYAVVVILVTNLIFTVGLFWFFRGETKAAGS